MLLCKNLCQKTRKKTKVVRNYTKYSCLRHSEDEGNALLYIIQKSTSKIKNLLRDQLSKLHIPKLQLI